MSIETEHLVLHPLTPAEARRIISRTPGPDDTWADGFPREDDLEALLAGSNRLWSAGAHQRDNFEGGATRASSLRPQQPSPAKTHRGRRGRRGSSSTSRLASGVGTGAT